MVWEKSKPNSKHKKVYTQRTSTFMSSMHCITQAPVGNDCEQCVRPFYFCLLRALLLLLFHVCFWCLRGLVKQCDQCSYLACTASRRRQWENSCHKAKATQQAPGKQKSVCITIQWFQRSCLTCTASRRRQGKRLNQRVIMIHARAHILINHIYNHTWHLIVNVLIQHALFQTGAGEEQL